MAAPEILDLLVMVRIHVGQPEGEARIHRGVVEDSLKIPKIVWKFGGKFENSIFSNLTKAVLCVFPAKRHHAPSNRSKRVFGVSRGLPKLPRRELQNPNRH